MNEAQMIFKNVYFIFLVGCMCQKLGAAECLYTRTYMLDKHTFQVDVFKNNGNIERCYQVDGIVSSSIVYYKRLQDAQENELGRACELADSIERLQVDSAYYLSKIKQFKKDFEQLIEQIKLAQLEPYFVFSSETIISPAHWDHLIDAIIPALALGQDSAAQMIPIDILNKLVVVLEALYVQVNQFYQQSLQAAIDQVDDPVKLKQLLVLKI